MLDTAISAICNAACANIPTTLTNCIQPVHVVPYRVEGIKTMGLELAEQLGWRLPDAIIYPIGGGTGIVGMWKAFAELVQLGWLTSKRMPKMIIVQVEGCSPLVRAFHEGREEAEPWPSQKARTKAAGLRVPSAIGDRLILQAVRESGGTALTVGDDEIATMAEYTAQQEGIFISLESATTVAAYHNLLTNHFLEPGDETVLFFTGSGLIDVGATARVARFGKLSQNLTKTVKCTTALAAQICYAKLGNYNMAKYNKNTILKR